MAASKSPLGEFVKLNDSVWLHEPDGKAELPATPAGATPAPDLILLMAWGSAPLRAVAKYTAGYESLYPSARIAVLMTPFSEPVLYRDGCMTKPLAPVLDLVGANAKGRILVHIFSNLGAFKLVELAQLWTAQHHTPLPITALALDSTPGWPYFGRTFWAFAAPLPKSPIIYYPGLVFVGLLLIFLGLYQRLTGRASEVHLAASRLNNPALISPATNRLYLYSKSDPMILWNDVVKHAHDAQGKGVDVRSEEFQGTLHVGHVVKYRERYWKAITDLWTASNKT